MSFYANFPLTGIFRKVSLFAVPETHVRRFHIQTLFDTAYRNSTLVVDLSVENESAHDANGALLEFSLKSPQGEVVPLADSRLSLPLAPWARLERRLQFRVTRPEHWEAEHPRLYRLSARLSGADGGGEVVSRRVGFRQVDIRGTDLLINGVSVKLRGTNHYDFHPLLGRAATPELTGRTSR
jgi:beta-galactosidase/beta-glucuronidase